MSTIHSYYITSQLFQLVEERVASIEVEKKLRPLASIFVKLFDDLDYNFSNELVAEALERLIIFVQKDGVTSTIEFSKVQAFFTDENDHLHVRVDDEVFAVVEPAEIEDDYEELDEVDGIEYEENDSISLEDDDSYIVIDGNQVIEEYELNEEISLEDDDTYLIIDGDDDEILAEEIEDENIHHLKFDSIPIVLDHGYAELVTLASTTDIDELIEEQIDDLPAFKEVLEELENIRKSAKKELKEDKKSKKSKKKSKKKHKKSKHKKDAKKGKDAKKEAKKALAAKIEKKLYKYIQEKELDQQLLTEFIQLKKQIDYILIQY